MKIDQGAQRPQTLQCIRGGKRLIGSAGDLDRPAEGMFAEEGLQEREFALRNPVKPHSSECAQNEDVIGAGP
jgi:hypothetical protein